METESSFVRDRNSLDKAHALKEQANKAYKDSDFASAIRLYHQCLLFAKAITQLSLTGLQEMARGEMDSDSTPTTQDSNSEADKASSSNPEQTKPVGKGTRSRMDSTTRGEEMKLEALELISKCYNNLAACIVNGPTRSKEDYIRATTYCDKVLEIEKDNEKALFRKGCAFKLAEKYDKAIEMFKKCSMNSQNKALIEECQMKEVEEKKKRDALIRANFAKHRAARNGDGGGPMNGNAVNGNLPGH